MKILFNIVLLLNLFPLLAHASDLPNGSAFIGLNEGDWYGYVIKENKLHQLEILKNIQEIVYSPASDMVYFIDIDDTLKSYRITDGLIAEIAVNTANRLTQLELVSSEYKKDELLAVSLVEGKSQRTKIVVFNSFSKNISHRLKGRMPLMEPKVFGSKVLYIGVHCVELCSQVAREIWVGSLYARDHKQVTSFGKFVKDPSWSKDGRSMYFVISEQAESSVYKYDLKSSETTKLTSGHVDSKPIESEDGAVYFLRQEGSLIGFFKTKNSQVERIDLPGISKIRGFNRARN